MNTVIVRRARGEQDVQTVAAMWNRASARLAARGLDQWQYPVKMHNIRSAVDAGSCWLALDAQGVTVGTITVDDSADPGLWFPDDNPNDALYLHRMVTESNAAGNNLGSALIDWAGRRAMAGGKSWVRLDAWRSNGGLRNYYVRQGFELVRVVADPSGSGACYQRPAGVQIGAGPTVVERGAGVST